MNKNILVIEDDIDDREILQETFDKVAPFTQLLFKDNGLAAVEYLYGLKEEPTKLPDLIVLDLNMPYLDGVEVYQKIKADAVLQNITTVVFTSSTRPSDRTWFTSLGVEFISKPDDFRHMQQIVKQILGEAASASS